MPKTVPHSYRSTLPERLRAASQALMGTTSGSKFCQLLEQAAIELESLSGPVSEAEAACAAMVKWCEKNDWGSVPKKLEERLRNACRATKEKA
jgi:hypothetical protein